MKSNYAIKGLILFLSIAFIAGLGISMITCGEQDDKGGPAGINGPFPSDRITVSFESETGSYSLNADGTSCLTFIARVVNKEGVGITGAWVAFATNLGYVSPAGAYTNSNGEATTHYCSGCIPGGALVAASTQGQIINRSVTLYGEEPSVRVERQFQNMGAAGTLNWNTVTGEFLCFGNGLVNAELQFWSELGCFHHGCDSIIITDVQGIASQSWYPPMWGTNVTDWADYNAPRSSVVRATYVENDEVTEYEGSAVIYIYPLHAKMWVGAELDPDTGLYNVDPYGNTPVIVYTYWQDAGGRYPQPGVEVDFELISVGGSGEGEAELTISKVSTDNTGYALTIISGNGGTGSASISAKIDVTGPGDCCYGTNDGWLWNDVKQLNIGGDQACQVAFGPIDLTGADAVPTGSCESVLVYVYSTDGPLDGAAVTASYDIDDWDTINPNGCAHIENFRSFTRLGYTFFQVCNDGCIQGSDWVWVTVRCLGTQVLFPYRVEYREPDNN